MVTTNYPDGITSFGVPVIGPGAGALPLIDSGGRYWFVSSVHGDNGNDGSFGSPFATWAFAADATSGNTALTAGDVIVLLPGHAETVVAAGGITMATARIRVAGIGSGNAKPTITFGTSTAASCLVSAANCSIVNVLGVGDIDALLHPFHVTASGFTGDITWKDGTDLKEAVYAVLADTVSDLDLKLTYRGFTSGSGTVSALALTAVTGARIVIDGYGKFNTSVIRTLTTACTNVVVNGVTYNTGVTDASKDFVDTPTGSTWFAYLWDASAGKIYVGGSGNALTAQT